MGIACVSKNPYKPADTTFARYFTWQELAPVVAFVAFEAFCSPAFIVGMGVGTAVHCIKIIIPSPKNKKPVPQQKYKPSKYRQWLEKQSLFNLAVAIPCYEEWKYRGFYQTGGIALAKRGVVFMQQCALSALQSRLITNIGIVAVAFKFGADHLKNPHAGARRQAVNATIGGLVEGILCARVGFLAAVGGHVANNLIVGLRLASLAAKTKNR